MDTIVTMSLNEYEEWEAEMFDLIADLAVDRELGKIFQRAIIIKKARIKRAKELLKPLPEIQM